MECNFVIDSKPLGDTVYSSFDYSGIQLFGVSNLSLKDCLVHRMLNIKSSSNGKKYSVSVKENFYYWSNGEKITTKQFFFGLKKSIETASYINKVLFAGLIGIRYVNNEIIFNLKEPNYNFLKLLLLPNYVPFNQNSNICSSGQYALFESKYNYYQFKSNIYFPIKEEPKDIKVSIIKNPKTNCDKFLSGEVDVTSDTAFPFHRYKQLSKLKEMKVSNTGLYASIIFGRELCKDTNLELRKIISESISNVDFYSATCGVWKRVFNYLEINSHNMVSMKKVVPLDFPILVEEKGSFSSIELKVAFDNFYPNKSITTKIVNSLNKAGLRSTLHEDDYYKPKGDYDLKLFLSPFYINDEYIRYASLGGLPFFDENEKLKNEYEILLGEYRKKLIIDNYETLQKFLDKNNVIIPLFFIPSIYMARTPNLLIKSFIKVPYAEKYTEV